MRVVQINASYDKGSTGSIVTDIQSLCLRAGIDCYVAYSTASLPKEKIVKGYQIGGLLDHKVHAAFPANVNFRVPDTQRKTENRIPVSSDIREIEPFRPFQY